MKFDRFLSLGASCEPAYQARRHTQTNSLHFFDWLHAPAENVITALETGFEHVFKLENLVLIPGASVRDVKTGFSYMHHFTRDEQKQLTMESVERQYLKQRAIIDLLIRDWKDVTSTETVLYVWRSRPNQEQMNRMLRVLRAARPDQPSFGVMLANWDDGPKLVSPDLFQVLIPQPPRGPDAWKGEDTAWTAAFVACEAWADRRQM